MDQGCTWQFGVYQPGAGGRPVGLPQESRCSISPQEVGDGLEPTVRMGREASCLAGRDVHGPHLVEEQEGVRILPRASGERPARIHAISVMRSRRRESPRNPRNPAVPGGSSPAVLLSCFQVS